MLLLSKPTIFFSEETINLDVWRIRKIAKAALSLLPSAPGYHIFIKLSIHIVFWLRTVVHQTFRWINGRQLLLVKVGDPKLSG